MIIWLWRKLGIFFGIPSFVVTQKGQELGRLVNKARKTKEEITAFLSEI